MVCISNCPEYKAFLSYFMSQSSRNDFPLISDQIAYFTPLFCSKTLPFCRKFMHQLVVTWLVINHQISELLQLDGFFHSFLSIKKVVF